MSLIQACAKGDLAMVKKFVAEGADINCVDNSGRTPLIEASWSGNTEVVKFLIEKGANVDATDNAGYSALMRACEVGHVPIITQLINKNASVNIRGKVRGTTPLMLAAEQGHIKILELLLSKGAKINATDQYEETAVARAYHSNQTKAAQFLESKGGRGKPDRSSLSHYSSRNKESKTFTKVALPQWSTADYDADAAEEEGVGAEAGGDEVLEE